MVSIDGYDSQWYTQRTGIRQGCPLSPYLFLLAMQAIFTDAVAARPWGIDRYRPAHAEHDAVFYADDTICISQNARTQSALISSIETEGAKYGMKLNHEKCELLNTGSTPSTVRFKDKSIMKTVPEGQLSGSPP